MRIVDVTLDHWRVPPHREIRDAVQQMEAVEVVAVSLETDEGVGGAGFTYTIGRGGESVMKLLETEVAPRLVGRDPLRFEEVSHGLWWDLHWVGRGGISQLAVSAVDIALWDLMGRHYGQPVWRLLGGAREEVELYHTDCGWLHHSKNQLVREAVRAVEEGFRGVKIKVGRPELREDIDRVAAVRRAVGEEVKVMVDANHAFTPAEAIRRGKRLEELDVFWFEEPVRADNVEGHARLREAVSIPVAVGESLYSLYDFKAYLEAGAVDIIQADICRCGGFTTWRKISALAEAWDIPVAPHYVMELHVHAVAGVPNGLFAEYIPAFSQVLETPLEVAGGRARAPEPSGTGMIFDRDKVHALSAT
jgi:L-alanine-DL-glutamate epimerase-like enolase superfamily enzyme